MSNELQDLDSNRSSAGSNDGDDNYYSRRLNALEKKVDKLDRELAARDFISQQNETKSETISVSSFAVTSNGDRNNCGYDGLFRSGNDPENTSLLSQFSNNYSGSVDIRRLVDILEKRLNTVQQALLEENEELRQQNKTMSETISNLSDMMSTMNNRIGTLESNNMQALRSTRDLRAGHFSSGPPQHQQHQQQKRPLPALPAPADVQQASKIRKKKSTSPSKSPKSSDSSAVSPGSSALPQTPPSSGQPAAASLNSNVINGNGTAAIPQAAASGNGRRTAATGGDNANNQPEQDPEVTVAHEFFENPDIRRIGVFVEKGYTLAYRTQSGEKIDIAYVGTKSRNGRSGQVSKDIHDLLTNSKDQKFDGEDSEAQFKEFLKGNGYEDVKMCIRKDKKIRTDLVLKRLYVPGVDFELGELDGKKKVPRSGDFAILMPLREEEDRDGMGIGAAFEFTVKSQTVLSFQRPEGVPYKHALVPDSSQPAITSGADNTSLELNDKTEAAGRMANEIALRMDVVRLCARSMIGQTGFVALYTFRFLRNLGNQQSLLDHIIDALYNGSAKLFEGFRRMHVLDVAQASSERTQFHGFEPRRVFPAPNEDLYTEHRRPVYWIHLAEPEFVSHSESHRAPKPPDSGGYKWPWPQYVGHDKPFAGAVYIAGVCNGNSEIIHPFREETATPEGKEAELARRSLRAAELGNVDEQMAISERYRLGHGVTKDLEEAVRWRDLAIAGVEAGNGNADTLVTLGDLFFHGAYGTAQNYDKAVQLWTLAQNGASFYRLAICYYYGCGVTKLDVNIASVLFVCAARLGDLESVWEVATLYYWGRGGYKKDRVTAVNWYLKAANQGHALSQCYLATWYYRGESWLEKNVEKSVMFSKKAAAQGFSHGLYRLALFYYDGEGGLKKDLAEAAKLFMQAANQGHAHSQFRLALMYYDGKGGLDKDLAEAAKYYEQAAVQGLAASQYNLALMYCNGQGGLHKDVKKAIEFWQSAANQGHTESLAILGLAYYNGELGLEKDLVEAAKWLKQAADQGDTVSMFVLGSMYDAGEDGVEKDVVKAVQLYKQAANQSHTESLVILGSMYYIGEDGVEKDVKNAIELWQTAANQGSASALYLLAVFYLKGEGGLEKDRVKAVELLKQAADQGHTDSLVLLGSMYYIGEGGLEKDRVKAVQLLEQAVDQGHTKSKELLFRINLSRVISECFPPDIANQKVADSQTVREK